MQKVAFAIILLCFIGANAIGQKKSRDSILHQLRELRSSPDFSIKDTNYILLGNQLAQSYRFLSSDSLYSISIKTLELSESADYERGKSEALDNLGNFYSDKGNGEKAIFYYKKALAIAEHIDDKAQWLGVLNNLAGEYAYVGNFSKALSNYLMGIDMATEINNKKLLSILNENIADLYASQKDFDQALNFYKKVKKINGEIGNDIISAETMSNVASIYSDIGRFDYALFNVNKSIDIFEEHKILDWLAFAYEVKGRIYLKQKKHYWALYWFNRSAELHKELDDERGKITLLNGMAKTYFHLEKDSLSLTYAEEGYQKSKKIKSLQGQIDCSETLYKIYKEKNLYNQALAYHEIFQRLSDSLSKDENKRGLALLKTTIEYNKERQLLIDNNQKALAKQRTYIYTSLFILLILGTITLLVYRSTKIQKKLYSQLKVKSDVLVQRETELSGMNKTKNKLFSIIGHDLRGPIGALQGLLKMFAANEIDQKEFLKLVPKLKVDVDHIFFTLNNLLSWGQTQMNGAVTRSKSNALETIVDDNINLLSEVAAKKSIKVLNQLPENVIVWADADQIDIVVRNLISNALKFTPENGLVTIEAEEKAKNWEVMVRDTGIGMDAETQQKIFDGNTNTTTYGTNNEKGTGLGLSLCKEMIEMNKGEIWVESYLRKGSCFYFTLPKTDKKYKQAG